MDGSTRLIVKGLPKHCDDKRLRSHFEALSDDVTDVRVMRTREGKSRCFGFVGFRDAEAAAIARKATERSYIDTSRISVEPAKRVGDEELARPWSRHSKGSSAYLHSHPEESASTKADGGAKAKKRGKLDDPIAARVHSDPKLAEFLELMAPKSKQKQLWSNDLTGGVPEPSRQRTAPAGSKRAAAGKGTDEEGSEEEEEDENDSEYDELPAASRKGGATVGDEGDGEEEEEDEDDDEEEEEEEEEATVASKASREMSDLDYLQSKKRKWLDDEDDEEGEEEEGEEEEEEEEEEEGEEEEETDWGGAAAVSDTRDGTDAASGTAAEAAADLGEHGRLFVRNLPFSVTEDELRGVFERFGEVAEVSVPMDAHTRRGKGFAHVRYARPEHAVSALSELDGAVFQGRLLHLMPARESAAERRRAAAAAAANGSVGAAGKGAAYKEQKEAAIKAKATDATNWNALFMRPDAVGDAMASRYGVAKADFLDPSADTSMAVRLAQGETHLIGQSTAWLAEHGVDLEALQRAVQGDGGPRGGANGGASAGGTQRSKLLILVKNLSTDVTEDELVTLFGRYGQLGAVLLTPARTLALVEFLEVGEARKAFRAVAYTKLHGVPLYLEWAPVGVLGSKGAAAEPTAPAEPIAPAAAKAGVVAAGAAGGEPEETVDADDTEGRTVFVKNLSFGSTKEDLEALFGRRYGVRAATVVTKPDPKSSNAKRLSMGYGFVEFKTAAHAQAALREMAGARLHEHVLQLKLSTRTTATATGAAAASSKGKKSKVAAGGAGGAGGGASMEPSAKLLVRNLPFQASQKEIKELFQTFGQLKTVRVPKKFDGHHRGFAFVEFVSKAEASKAKNALHATHLYGRHLVLEYAEEERSVEAMREKLRGQQAAAADEESAGGAKRKKRKGADGEGEGLLDDLDL